MIDERRIKLTEEELKKTLADKLKISAGQIKGMRWNRKNKILIIEIEPIEPKEEV